MPPGADSEPAPPLNHVLRPHHLAILSIFLLAYRRNLVASPLFLLHIHRVLMEEIAEITEPKQFDELVQDLTAGYSPTSQEALSFARVASMVPKQLHTVDALHELFANIIALVLEKDEDTMLTGSNAVFERHSFFGLFCRRCYVSFGKLTFAGVDRLRQDFTQWSTSEDVDAGYKIQETNRKGNGQLLFPTAADEKDYGTATSFKAFQYASAEGDMSQAVDHLRLFFDQHFSDSNESGLRQHALLNLAHLHYSNREYVAARKYLVEAITVARTSGDKLTLQYCVSLLRRFTPHEGSTTLPLTEIQVNASASDVVSDVLKLVMQTKEPIISSFSRMLQALGCYDSATDPKGGPPPEHEQWNIHAVQCFLWKIAGALVLSIFTVPVCPNTLLEPEENIILSFTDAGCANGARWDALRTRAERLSRQGRRNEALMVLLDPECWRGLDLRQYNEWACVVWCVLVTHVIRRGQMRHFHEYLREQMPSIRPKDFYDLWPKTFPPSIQQSLSPLLERDSIMHAKYHYRIKDSLLAIHPLLQGLFAAEFRGHWPVYRIGIVMLADLALDLGMKKYGLRALEEIMPQIIHGDDIELRGFACHILSRCIVASSDGQLDIIRGAIPYLLSSEEDYGTLQMLNCQQDVLYFLASVYNTLGMFDERDAAAARHAKCVEKAKELVREALPEELRNIWSIVVEVGSITAAGIGRFIE